MAGGPKVLEVLLDATLEWSEAKTLVKAKAVRCGQALCGLEPPSDRGAGLCFTARCQDSGRCCRRRVAAQAGSFTEFIWETTETLQASPVKERLLALNSHNDLGIYELCVQDGICDVTNTHSCSEEALKKLVESKNLSLPSSFTVKILSFKNSKSCMLLNNCTLLHLTWMESTSEADVLGCFKLHLPGGAAERITDSPICQEMLFLLDSAGWIYIYDTVDGKQRGSVNLALCQAGETEEANDVCDLSCLDRLWLSHDLHIAVAVNSVNSAVCVNLNNFFRKHPENLEHTRKASADAPLKAPVGVDEDDLASSVYSSKQLNLSFQMDRSWKARLGTFYSETKVSSAERFLQWSPWYHHLSSQNSHDATCNVNSYKSSLVPCDDVAKSFAHEEDVNNKANKLRWMVQLQGLEESMRIQTVSLSEFSVLFTLVAPDSGAVTVAFWDLETQQVDYHHIKGQSLPVEGDGNDELSLFLTDTGLSMVVFAFSQEDLLNRLMIYGKAGIVDSLCHLNHWNRCSIPIHALEAGIENRQLDTVDFFLKSKEKLFCAPATLSAQEPSGAAIMSSVQLTNVEEIKPALDLLCSAIRVNYSETQGKQFSEQLLNLTLTFLNKQMQELLTQSGELDKYKQKCVDYLTSYIIKLRKFMKKYPRTPPNETVTSDCLGEENILPDGNHVYGKWKNLNTNEIVRDAILSNQIPRAQSYFTVQQTSMKDLNKLMQAGLNLTYKSLLKKDLQEARQLLKNMGFDVKRQLHRICCYTADRDLRDFLVENLQDCLSEEEKEWVKFVHFVESLYSSAQIMECPLQNSVLQAENIDPSFAAVLEPIINSDVGDTEHAERDSNCCVVILDWAKWWDKVAKEQIKLCRELDVDLLAAIQFCSPEVLWTSLTSRHCWAKVRDWIEMFQSSENSANWPPLSPDIVNQSTHCSNYMRNEILDILARKGVFIPSELANFRQFLVRLSCAGGVMQKSHPVPVYQSPDGLDFYSCFILFCLEHELRYLLYAYLDYYGLKPSNCPLLDDTALHVAHPWFEFLVRMREVADKLDTSVTFRASLANAQMLIPSNQASVSSMLLEGHTLMALATIMFAPGGIDQVMQERKDVSDSLWKVDSQLLKMALSPYPKLRTALFPQLTPYGIPPLDISLYHLLQSLHPFDPSRLFGWQSANVLSTCDLSNDLPHFSCPDLVNKYAITERLDFSYYLRHGRPSYAFATFVVQQLAKSSSPKQSIQQASIEAYTLGLAHFTVPAVAAACVAFLELLGVSSFKLRIDLKVADAILKLWCTNAEETQRSLLRDTLAEKLQNLIEFNGSAAEELLTHLENATWENLKTRDISRTSFEAGQEWSLVAQFCKLHGITVSLAYLQECAREDAWLQFVIFAQLHNYQPNEVKALLKDFSPALQDHLTLAFQNLQFVAQEKPVICSVTKEETNKRDESPVDLFQVLYWCQEKAKPWRYLLSEAVRHSAPVLSVLAACFQETDVLQCLCVWIIMTSDDAIVSEVTKHINDSIEYHEWNLHDLSLMWKVLLERRKSKQLVRGFQLFQKHCPWVYMLEMYELCTEHKNYQESKLRLQEFQKCLLTLKAEDSASTDIPVQWMESQADLLLKLMIQQCPTQYELGKLLQILADVDCGLKISEDFGLDFRKLSRLSQLLQDTSISIDPSLLVDCSTGTLQNVCGQILDQLQKKGLFALARQVADLAQLPVDHLVVHEVTQELQNLKQSGQWQRKETRINFWKKCHDCFKNYLISNVVASEFFLAQVNEMPVIKSLLPSSFKDQSLNIQERCLLLTMAGHWLSQSNPPNLDQLEELEKRIWLCRISQQTLLMSTNSRFAWQLSVCGEITFDGATKEFLFSKLPALNSPKYLRLEGFPNKDMASNCALDAAERDALNILIGELLDGGCVHEASRVCGYFEFYNQDTSLVLHCRAMASGELQTVDFHPSVQIILTAGASFNGEIGFHRKRIPSLSSVTSSFGQCSEEDSVKDQVVKDLQILTNECYHGKGYCRQVLSLYQLSKELGCSFNDISTQDSDTVLREVLSSQQPDRYKKAQAFISTQELKPETVAALIAEEVVQASLSSVEAKGVRQIYKHLDGKEAFLQLAKLCQDPILVGTKLLDKISSIPNGELECTVELLILAHDCFSLTCHMEGISRVLQAARHLSHKHLAPKEAYSLMVRLVTGIGRYNDMTYIFDLLHENHRFEMLLRKNVESNGDLKTALLDYIKRCLPGDSEKHNMVAFCFSMCREIGENHEGAARVQLKIIESQSWEVTPELKKSLVKVLNFLKDAAESYSKDSCIRRASQCVKLAKLVTLQLHLLNNNRDVQLINLQRNDLMPCILSLPRFYQAAIVAEAYDFVPDWAEVLYEQVIVRGEFSYLEEFKQQNHVQQSLFEEISNKFKRHKGDVAASQNMKKLLQHCENVYLVYKLAYEHNFTDVANKLLKEPQTSCYLNDMIAS
ncbi:spatacsin [Hemiscyllium ocellatum]|uniref:spatacsin n=1 Tax=Hemiscyllium ocellatum TaxID=170820 RepID=UPI00296743D7|nr:spatacsin [Hemiscyllium ocellatum]